MGSTSNYTYIIFVCENAAKIIWAPSNIKNYYYYNVVTYLNPIKLITNVASVKIESTPTVIQEGEPFGNSASIFVNDQDGHPLSNKLIICLIASINNQTLNYRYSYTKKGFLNKDIIKPFPGKYSQTTLDPLSSDQDQSFFPILTNNQGNAKFSETFFSVYGITGIIYNIILSKTIK